MAAFQVDIEKRLALGTEFWSNRYLVDADTIQEANQIASTLVLIEQQIHGTPVEITKVRASSTAPNDDVFITTQLGIFGLRQLGDDTLPLFNVVRVDLGVSVGRPSRKFLRLPLQESEQANGVLATALRDAVVNLYIQPLLELGTVIDPQSAPIVSGSVFSRVAMRQLRRGSRRRSTPIIPNP